MNFKNIVYDYYHKHGRNFCWREDITPYKVFVSEIMLQQTQTSRIEIRLPLFLKTFPTLESLASASTAEVLTAWQGLGYNRRGLYLHQTAKTLVSDFNSIIPKDPLILKKLPGIGDYTSCSIVTFAYNCPTVFIETNIRTVYLHHYFQGKTQVSDKEIIELIQQDLDMIDPRSWYYALMDYGVYIKSQFGSLNHQSKHYRKQSKFEGSNRQVRAKILKYLLKKPMTQLELQRLFEEKEFRVLSNIEALQKEGMIDTNNNEYFIIDD
jgi:A/G-specific adenine glycosylase